MSEDTTYNTVNASVDLVPLEKISRVLQRMEQRSIRYCHWKSNYHIKEAISGLEDIDILIDHADFPNFVEIMIDAGCRQAESINNRSQPGVFHFLGNDEATGLQINFHAYTRILTGDHLLKSWALPFEKMLLEETQKQNIVRVPPRSTDVIIYVIRNLIKHTTLIDLYLSSRSTSLRISEHRWITSDLDMNETKRKLEKYFPEITYKDFIAALKLLEYDSPLYKRILLGFKFAKKLKKYRRYSQPKQLALTAQWCFKMFWGKFQKKEKYMNLLTGGKIIAFVGPQATGKSTIINSTRKWLGTELSVRTIHSGKPPATFLTLVLNLLIPLGRVIFSKQRTIDIELKAAENEEFNYSLLYIIRKLMVAYERKILLRKAFRESRNGKIILSDRYPSDTIGAVDSASFTDEHIEKEKSGLKRFLMRTERKLYKDICSPDLIIQLSVSVEKAVERNKVRIKKGFQQSTLYVIARHSQKRHPKFSGCPVFKVSTDDDLETTILKVKDIIWKEL